MNPASLRVHVGRVARAQGLAGQLRLSTFDHAAPSLREGAQLWLRSKDGAEKVFTVRAIRRSPDGIVVDVDGVTTRTAAEALQGLEVHIAQADLPSLGHNEFWAFELAGFAAVDETGARLGEVVQVAHGVAHDLLEVRLPSGAVKVVPWVEALIPRVDRDSRTVVIRAIPGLLDEDAAAE